ncbi:hypothetical protein GCM10020229_24750 [Kitasatospora albolonga]
MSRQRERVPVERTEYAHVIVDEAQDLTPMQWRMVGRRARMATWTIVGDPAQSSWPFPQEAQAAMDEVLAGKPRRRHTLTVNYRNPSEIAEVAAKVLELAAPGTPSPTAVRSTGLEPRFAAVGSTEPAAVAAAARAELERLLAEVDGTVAVVVPMDRRAEAAGWVAGLGERAVALGSLEAKGLEYDATVVADPVGIAGESEAGPAGAVRGSDPGHPAAHRALRPGRPAGRGRGAGAAALTDRQLTRGQRKAPSPDLVRGPSKL